MPTFREDKAGGDRGEVSNTRDDDTQPSSCNAELEEEDVIDSQQTVKTDNTSKGNEDDVIVIESQLTAKTDNTSKGNEDDNINNNELDKTVFEKEVGEEKLDLPKAKDGATHGEIAKEDDEKEFSSSSPRYETAREESNDSFPRSTLMLTPLEPLEALQQQLQLEESTSQQDTQPHRQAEASKTTTITSLLQTDSTLLTQQDPEEQQLDTQGTATSSDLELDMSQSQQTNLGKSQQSQQHNDDHEKSPALFEDAMDRDFIEYFASKMNGKTECGKKKKDGTDEDDVMSIDGDEANHGNEQEGEHCGKKNEDSEDIFFKANESDSENDVENYGVGLLTQAVNDEEDESMSEVNSVRTQESERNKASSNDGDIMTTTSDDNAVIVYVIQERDIIVNVKNDCGGHANPPLSGLTGPSQSQADAAPVQQAKNLSQRSNSNKHVSFQQDNLTGREKSPQIDLEGRSGEKEEEDEDDVAEKKATQVIVTAKEGGEWEEGEGGIMDTNEECSDTKMIDGPNNSHHHDEEANDLKVDERNLTEAVTHKKDESQPALPAPEQQNADGATHASDDEIAEDDEPQQTSDAIITTGSGSIGWSLYDGETQQLLSGPSQILTVPSMPPLDSDPANEEEEIKTGDPTAKHDDDIKIILDETAKKVDNNDECNENEPTQPLEKPKSVYDVVDSYNKEAEYEYKGDDNSVEIKHTQENGLPNALSYPNDHIEKVQSPLKAAKPDHTHDLDSQTQQSQDLLALTPLRQKRGSPKKSPAQQKDENNVILSTTEHNVQQKSSPKHSNKELIKAANPSKWLSITREEASPEGPRLVIPSFMTAEKPTLNRNVEDASDDEAWVGHGLKNDHPEDDIENTQDDYMQQKDSFLKHSSAKRSRSPSNDSSTADEVEDLDENVSPKVLWYGDLKQKSEPADIQSQSSSEAEFDEEYCDDSDDESVVGRTIFPQSQTDEAIKRQLKEIQEMTLPSTKQLKEMASRKRMLDQIAELRERHEQEMNALKQENTKLRNAIKKKDDIISNKDLQLAEKKKLLNEQKAAITTLMEKLEIINSASIEHPVLPSSTKKRTPLSKSGKKRKQREEEVTSLESDDDALPLSALKREPVKKSSAFKTSGQSEPPKPTRAKAAHDDLSVQGKASSKMKAASARSFLSNDLSKHWKELEEKGWSYKTGPEPYNKVYVPKDGATHMGCRLGIHFFTADQVIPEAIRRGDLNSDGTVLPSNVLPSNEDDTPQATNQIKHQINDLDDSSLHGLVTLETARVAIDLVGRFIRGQDSATFRGHLFDPLWQRLKEQGAEAGNNWRYEPYSSPLSMYSWCFVPPTSSLGNKGTLGDDFYVREEHLVLGVLQSVASLGEVSSLLKKRQSAFSTVMPILTRAVDDNMSYEDARDGKDPSVRSRRARVLDESPEKSVKVNPSRKASPRRHPTVTSTAEAALSSSKKKPVSTKKTPDKKRTRTVSPNSGSGKKQKTDEVEHVLSPSFHMDQTQTQVPVPSYERRSSSSTSGPLSGYTFLCSGVNQFVNGRIKKLGGEIADFESLNRNNSYRKLFFLSDQQGWRKPKYVYAAALGAPMLHIDWLAKIEEKYEDEGDVSVFDSSLYTRYRLPTGLDFHQRSYTLQRASHARDWVRPGQRGEDLFEGMTIALALGAEEKVWKMTLEACGATVRVLSDIRGGKGQVTVDCCLFNAAADLPPHVTSLPLHVTKLVEFIDQANTPLLDLAWAHQSIIQRRCLPMDGERFAVSLKDNMCNLCNVNSIRRSNGGRFETGDIIQFSRGKSVSYGRIVKILWDRHAKGCKLEIQILESSGGYDLIDCESCPSVTVDEACIQGQVVLLSGVKDFLKLGYLPKNATRSNIYSRVSESNQSQM